MSSFNVKSTIITNRDATPAVLNQPFLTAGQVCETYDVGRLPQTADAGSQLRLVQVPSNARLSDLHYVAQQLGTSAIDIAAWFPTSIQGGALAQSGVVAAQLISSSSFAANIAGVDTGIALTDGMGTVAQQSLARRQQPLWQNLGLVQDPQCMIDLGFTVRTANSIAGYAGLRARYVY